MEKDRIESYLRKKDAIELLSAGEYIDENSAMEAKFKLLEDILYELRIELKGR